MNKETFKKAIGKLLDDCCRQSIEIESEGNEPILKPEMMTISRYGVLRFVGE